MSLREALAGGGGLLLLLLTLVEIAPIKVNPWSALAKALGRAINADVLKELGAVKQGLAGPGAIGVQEMLLGNIPGSLGEVAAAALLCGFVYLLWRRVITWHIPVTVLATMAVFAGVAMCSVSFDALPQAADGTCSAGYKLGYLFGTAWRAGIFHVLAGGAMLGAIFMATDYSTSPMTVRGGVIFAVGMCIRLWGAYPEGMSFAILIMNACVPLINKYVKPKRFGVK